MAEPKDNVPDQSGKGRPTPKRREAQAAQRRPLVPTDRRAAARASREKQKATRSRAQQGMLAGDERYLSSRDKGPQRRYARDFIDARWNLAEFFLPVSFGVVLMVLIAGDNVALAFAAILALYALMGITVLDAWLAGRQLRKRLIAKFGSMQKGTVLYAAMRAYQIRGTRMPRATVARGQYPS